MTDIPYIPLDLLDTLNERFPERSAELGWSEKEVWFRAGQREVIRFLNATSAAQNENILETASYVQRT